MLHEHHANITSVSVHIYMHVSPGRKCLSLIFLYLSCGFSSYVFYFSAREWLEENAQAAVIVRITGQATTEDAPPSPLKSQLCAAS